MRIIEAYLRDTSYQIYCDMDGVLCDFSSQFEKLSGKPEEGFTAKYGEPLFWKIVASGKMDFWTTMPWLDDGRKLWAYIKKYRPIILSSPGRNSYAPKGKRLWVRKNLGTNVLLILEQSAKKKQHANEKTILIDDREDNVAGWKEAGGIGIVYKTANDAINQLKRLGL